MSGLRCVFCDKLSQKVSVGGYFNLTHTSCPSIDDFAAAFDWREKTTFYTPLPAENLLGLEARCLPAHHRTKEQQRELHRSSELEVDAFENPLLPNGPRWRQRLHGRRAAERERTVATVASSLPFSRDVWRPQTPRRLPEQKTRRHSSKALMEGPQNTFSPFLPAPPYTFAVDFRRRAVCKGIKDVPSIAGNNCHRKRVRPLHWSCGLLFFGGGGGGGEWGECGRGGGGGSWSGKGRGGGGGWERKEGQRELITMCYSSRALHSAVIPSFSDHTSDWDSLDWQTMSACRPHFCPHSIGTSNARHKFV